MGTLLKNALSSLSNAASPKEKCLMQEAEDFAYSLQRLADLAEENLGQKIYELAGHLCQATTMTHREAIYQIRYWIEKEINRRSSIAINDSVQNVFSWVTKTYLTDPHNAFDQRQEAIAKDDMSR